MLQVELDPALLKLIAFCFYLVLRSRTLDTNVQLDTLKDKRLSGVFFCVIKYRDKHCNTIYIFRTIAVVVLRLILCALRMCVITPLNNFIFQAWYVSCGLRKEQTCSLPCGKGILLVFPYYWIIF